MRKPHYIYSAYEAMEKWFEEQPDSEGAAINMRKALAEHVYLIWYEAPEGARTIASCSGA